MELWEAQRDLHLPREESHLCFFQPWLRGLISSLQPDLGPGVGPQNAGWTLQLDGYF